MSRNFILGLKVAEISDDNLAGDLCFGLAVADKTLVIPDHNSKNVLFYNLNK